MKLVHETWEEEGGIVMVRLASPDGDGARALLPTTRVSTTASSAITGMRISGKISVAMLRNANGVASRISKAITRKVYGLRSASWTMDMMRRSDQKMA